MVYAGIETFFRNPRKIEYRLLAGILFVISLMFLEEFVRQLLPVSSSPGMVTYVFGNLGVISSCLIMHFYMHITGWIKQIGRTVALTVSYVPLVPVILTLALRRNLFNSVEFKRIGIWTQPTYNVPYYIAIWIGVLVMATMVLLTYYAARQANSVQVKNRLMVIFYGTLFNGVWSVLSGGFAGVITVLYDFPPYLYIYGLVVWILVIRWAMFKHDFLPSHEKMYRTLFNLSPTAILTIDERGNIFEANPKARSLFGDGAVNWCDIIIGNQREHLSKWMTQHFTGMVKTEDEEVELLQQDGTPMTAVVDTEAIEFQGVLLLLIMIRDITERIQSEQEYRTLAYYDPLSELPNRIYFNRLLQDTITRATDTGENFGVILLDVDNFKKINDSFGHLVGDAIINQVGRGLQEALPFGGVAARLGGDEFVAIVYPVSHAERMEEVLQAITHALTTTFVIEGREISVRVSIGFSLYPDDGHTQYDLIKRADLHMYSAKHWTP